MVTHEAAATSLLLTLFLSLGALILSTNADAYNSVPTEKNNIPALYIFGDSTADVGTNNFLASSTAKANFRPYGIDLIPSSPTGRFSNGLNTVDFVAKLMGFSRSPPPFLSIKYLTDARIGVNFASGGSGILDTTGEPFVQFVSMNEQIRQFQRIHSKLVAQIGNEGAQNHLSNSVFLISTGSNDLIQTFSTLGHKKYHAQKRDLPAILVHSYKLQIKKLYQLGAKKFGVVSISPIGCCPSQRRFNATGGCLEDLNDSALEFYYLTETMLKDLSYQLAGFKFALGNGFELVINLFRNSAALGFTELQSACCGAGSFYGESRCLPTSRFCSNRDKFLFWDSFHPTQAASKLAAQTLFGGTTEFVTPINLSLLAAA